MRESFGKARFEVPKLWLFLGGVLLLAALSSCATRNYYTNALPAFEKPPDCALEKSAGRLGLLTVKIRLENGQELRCALDTGSPRSLLPASLEHSLGKCLGTGKCLALDGIEPEPTRIYAAPKIYLGNALLVNGPRVETIAAPYAVLGMDCLSHYCIQPDFISETLRFLDPDNLDSAELGRAFELLDSPYATIEQFPLFGTRNVKLLVDTGCLFDGYRKPGPFHEAARMQQARPIPIKTDASLKPGTFEFAEFSKCVWDSNTYTNLVIAQGRTDLVGMRFLGRHLVTFNFPKRVMYLKQESVGPLK
jgi:hypothetical protein